MPKSTTRAHAFPGGTNSSRPKCVGTGWNWLELAFFANPRFGGVNVSYNAGKSVKWPTFST